MDDTQHNRRKSDLPPDAEARYEQIKTHGYRIDVRGPYAMLIRGQVAIQYPTWLGALIAAERELTRDGTANVP